MNLEEKIIQKIKDDNLKPKSIWYFLAKDYSLWAFVVLSVLLGALAIAPIIFISSNFEPGYIKHISNNQITFILSILPYPWIILCILTTYFARVAWKHTKTGYKFQGKYILIISVLTSLILAIVANLYSLGKEIDDGVGNRSFGMYKNMDTRKQENWFNPKEGRLIGAITVISTTSFTLFNEKNNYEEVVNFDETVPGQEFVDTANVIRVVGFEDGDKTFFACAIFPDNILPPNQRKSPKEMQDKMRQRFETNPECKEVFDNGRANFQPKIKQTNLKQN